MNDTAFTPRQLRRAWLIPMIPLAALYLAWVLLTLFVGETSWGRPMQVAVFGAIAATFGLHAKYGEAPLPTHVDRLLRDQGRVRIHSVPRLAPVLVIFGALLAGAGIFGIVLNWERWLHKGVSVTWWQHATLAGIAMVTLGWQRPWDTTIRRVGEA